MNKTSVRIVIKITLVAVYTLLAMDIFFPKIDVFEIPYFLSMPVTCLYEIIAYQILGWLMGAFLNEFITTQIEVDKRLLLVICIFLLIMTFSTPLGFLTNAAWPVITIEKAKYFNILLGIILAVLVKQKIMKNINKKELDDNNDRNIH